MTSCPVCKKLRADKSVERRRMNTAYINDESNYLTSCRSCFLRSEEYWKEQWDDYYSMVGGW